MVKYVIRNGIKNKNVCWKIESTDKTIKIWINNRNICLEIYIYLYLIIMGYYFWQYVIEISLEVAKYYTSMPPKSDKKKFHTGESLPGLAHAVVTFYVALCALGEDASRSFGSAHVRAVSFLNFVFYFSFPFRFYTLNNLGH